jgi:ferrochelatase
MRNRQRFLAAGGEACDYIPALNASDAHARLLERLIRQHTQGWPGFAGEAGNLYPIVRDATDPRFGY